jgi:RIO kinase 1
MKTPARLQTLLDEGLIDSVVRQLKSGKEADVYVVRCGERDLRGQDLQGSPQAQLSPGGGLHREPQGAQQPAGARHGQAHELRAASSRKRAGRAPRSTRCTAWPRRVRVPRPSNFHDGVLLMELVADDRATPRRA